MKKGCLHRLATRLFFAVIAVGFCLSLSASDPVAPIPRRPNIAARSVFNTRHARKLPQKPFVETPQARDEKVAPAALVAEISSPDSAVSSDRVADRAVPEMSIRQERPGFESAPEPQPQQLAAAKSVDASDTIVERASVVEPAPQEVSITSVLAAAAEAVSVVAEETHAVVAASNESAADAVVALADHLPGDQLQISDVSDQRELSAARSESVAMQLCQSEIADERPQEDPEGESALAVESMHVALDESLLATKEMVVLNEDEAMDPEMPAVVAMPVAEEKMVVVQQDDDGEKKSEIMQRDPGLPFPLHGIAFQNFDAPLPKTVAGQRVAERRHQKRHERRMRSRAGRRSDLA